MGVRASSCVRRDVPVARRVPKHVEWRLVVTICTAKQHLLVDGGLGLGEMMQPWNSGVA